VGEAHQELVDHPALAYRARDRGDAGFGWPFADEVRAVEGPDRVPAMPAHHGRHVVDEGVGHHRGHGLVNVAVDELGPDVLVEQGPQGCFLVSHPRFHSIPQVT
jgi:hypothetical protein